MRSRAFGALRNALVIAGAMATGTALSCTGQIVEPEGAPAAANGALPPAATTMPSASSSTPPTSSSTPPASSTTPPISNPDSGAPPCDPSDPACAGCAPGEVLCGGQCTDPANDAANCGQCGTACAPSDICDRGTCTPRTTGCSTGTVLCGSSCVDTSSSADHCGTCDTVCGTGQLCASGACACLSGTLCGGACVDTQTSLTNCGSCNNPCDGGRSCSGGVCSCPGTGTFCGGACVDTQTSLVHCGACNSPCASGETCSAGVCQAPPGADGCGAAARGLTLKQVAVYQSVKIPVMDGGAAVDPAVRVAGVVAGRDTLFRVFVTVDPGFAARQLSARVTVTNGTAQDQYFARQTLSSSSSDADTSSTFQVAVPKDKIQVGTRYSVEVVECTGGGSGTLEAPRFPASGDTDLGTIPTGPLKIRVVPVLANSRLPDTSDAALAVYRTFMMAMYPTNDVQLSVATQITTNYPVDWPGLLDQIRSKRQSDAPPADVYYYGLLRPTDTLQQYCQTACTAGIGYVSSASQAQTRAAVGLAFSDDTSAFVMSHEVGHNHGRDHAPCAPGAITGVDASYPYAGASIGVWGYDSHIQTFYDPTNTTDVMGYCSRRWISDYTYRGLIDRVRTVNGVFDQIVQPEAIAQFRVLLVDANGPRWGIPFDAPGAAFGEPEDAEILAADGTVLTHVTVYRTAIGDADASTVLVPPPGAGWFAVRVKGSGPLLFPTAAGSP